MEIDKSFITRDGVKIGYRGPQQVDPERPSVLLIHGLASNLTRWSEFVEHTRLHQGYNIFRIDLRGRQRSIHHGIITRKKWVADIIELMDREAVTRFIFIGHSLGAQVAQAFACKHPQRTQGLVFIDPVYADNLHGALATVKRFKWLGWLVLWVILFFTKLGLHRKTYTVRDMHQLDLKTRATLEANPDLTIADLYMSPKADLEYIPISSYLQDLLSVTQSTCPARNIQAPVRVLLSAGASVSSYDKNLAIIHSYPDNGTTEIEADHWLLTERPHEAREALEAFVDDIAARTK
ncbi:MAG: alpha/beta hydrolase [Gammaproteobacteria bacterium]|nr:alpha/beta hydrolase [Gammaproteobacteria bacterium]